MISRISIGRLRNRNGAGLRAAILCLLLVFGVLNEEGARSVRSDDGCDDGD